MTCDVRKVRDGTRPGPLSHFRRPMTDKSQLCVEVRNQDIIVTMPAISLTLGRSTSGTMKAARREPSVGPFAYAPDMLS